MRENMSCLWLNLWSKCDSKRCKQKHYQLHFINTSRHIQTRTVWYATLTEKKLSQCQIEEMKWCSNFSFSSSSSFFHVFHIALVNAYLYVCMCVCSTFAFVNTSKGCINKFANAAWCQTSQTPFPPFSTFSTLQFFRKQWCQIVDKMAKTHFIAKDIKHILD